MISQSLEKSTGEYLEISFSMSPPLIRSSQAPDWRSGVYTCMAELYGFEVVMRHLKIGDRLQGGMFQWIPLTIGTLAQ